jgi:HK97 family phage prohead protease
MKAGIEVKSGGLAIALPSDSTSGDTFLIGGYAAVFGNVDLGQDRVLKGCFAESLAVRPSVPVLWQHDTKEPIGKTTLLVEDATGLLFKARISPTRRGQEVAVLSRDGAISGMSIGYTVKRERKVTENGQTVRELLSADVVEVSPCTFPMNPRARFASLAKASRAVIEDRLLIAELDQKKARGYEISRKEWAAYADAQVREAERGIYDGKTERQWRYGVLYEVQEALKEIEALR